MPKKVFKEERNENKKRKIRGVTTSYIQQKEDRTVKDRNDETLGFDFVFVV